MTNVSGDILLQIPQQGFVPATSKLGREHYGHAVEADKIHITEGQGRHPRVKITMPAMVLGMVSVNLLGIKDCEALLSIIGKGDVSAQLRQHNSHRTELLYSQFEENAAIYADCVAVNDAGTMALKPDEVPGEWQAMRVRIKSQNREGFLGLARLDVPISYDKETYFATIEHEKPLFTPIVVTKLEAVALASVSRVTLLLPEGKRRTKREMALIEMGMAVETYTGERPSGIKFNKAKTLKA